MILNFLSNAPLLKEILKKGKDRNKPFQYLNRVFWCQERDLNSRPPAYETSALTS